MPAEGSDETLGRPARPFEDYVTETALVDYSIATQVWIQLQGVLVTVALSGGVAAIALTIVKYTVGLRVVEEHEREGLDITSHGESAYEA